MLPFVIGLALALPITPSPDPLTVAEDLYRSHEYKKAYELWDAAYPRLKPTLSSALRMSELKMLYEGREPAVRLLKEFQKGNWTGLGPRGKRDLIERWKEYRSVFASDQGQSLYYQAEQKRALGDCESALGLYQQAEIYDPGNFVVQSAQAKCYRSLGNIPKLKQTLLQADESFPFDGATHVGLGEVWLAKGEFQKVGAAPWADLDATLRPRYQTTVALAVLSLGRPGEAVALLTPLLGHDPHPVVDYGLAKGHLGLGHTTEAKKYFARFLALAEPYACVIDGWDPYDCQGKAQEARQLMEKMDSKSRASILPPKA